MIGLLHAIVSAALSLVIGCSSQTSTVIPFCYEDDCYIRPRLDYYGKHWLEAQKICRMYNSTLPIVNNPDRQRSVLAAIYHFGLNDTMNVWLGAKATDYGSGNWSWLDGRQYSETVVPNSGEYSEGYAFLSNNGTGILAYASVPYATYSYICQYNTTTTDVCSNGTGRLAFLMESICYVKYSDKLFWFNARNNCLENNGDLASFANVSLLDGIVDSNESWIGLRRSQWKWQNAVTGESSDVTFTSWSINQPDDYIPDCATIDHTHFPYWEDWVCSNSARYICQVINNSSLVSTTTTSVDPNARGDSQQNDRVVAVGVGIGVPCAIVILVLVVAPACIVQQRKLRRNGAELNSEGPQITDSNEMSTSSPTSVSPAVEDDANCTYQYQQLQNGI